MCLLIVYTHSIKIYGTADFFWRLQKGPHKKGVRINGWKHPHSSVTVLNKHPVYKSFRDHEQYLPHEDLQVCRLRTLA